MVVADGTAAERVDEHEEHQNDDVERGHGSPVEPCGGHHAGLARVALEAQHALVVAPRAAVDGVRRRGRARRGGCPERRVDGLEPAVRRRLAAARLHRWALASLHSRRREYIINRGRRVMITSLPRWHSGMSSGTTNRAVHGGAMHVLPCNATGGSVHACVPERAAGTAGTARRR